MHPLTRYRNVLCFCSSFIFCAADVAYPSNLRRGSEGLLSRLLSIKQIMVAHVINAVCLLFFDYGPACSSYRQSGTSHGNHGSVNGIPYDALLVCRLGEQSHFRRPGRFADWKSSHTLDARVGLLTGRTVTLWTSLLTELKAREARMAPPCPSALLSTAAPTQYFKTILQGQYYYWYGTK